jgi:hypothetical protein
MPSEVLNAVVSNPAENQKFEIEKGATYNKHKNAITVLSAFIVFVSFMVKEGWDEHLKDLTSAIRSAEDEVRRADEFETFYTGPSRKFRSPRRKSCQQTDRRPSQFKALRESRERNFPMYACK